MKDPVWRVLVVYALAVVALLSLALLFSSCEVLKRKSSVVKDSLSVARVDSGKVNIRTETKTDSLAWWREIVNFSRDTTIVQPGVTNVYPTSYIREGGTQTIKEVSINYDSLWNNKMDSLVYKLSQTDKSKQTKVLNMWQIIGLAAGVCLVFFLLNKLKIGLK